MPFDKILDWATGIGLGLLPVVIAAGMFVLAGRRAERESKERPSIDAPGIVAIGGALASKDAAIQIVEGMGKLSASVAELVRLMKEIRQPSESVQAIEESSRRMEEFLSRIADVVEREGHEAFIEREVRRRHPT